MRPCASLAGRHWAVAGGRAAEVRALPEDVPLDRLSIRSVMDRAMGRGAWRAHRPAATSLQALPSLHDAARLAGVRDALRTRAVREEQFVLWYNIMTRPSWAESAALLQHATDVPPFVLQRALHRTTAADAASAVEEARRHFPRYTTDVQSRMVTLLVDRCFGVRAWHVAAPLTSLLLSTCTAWCTRKQPQPEKAQALLQHAAAYLLRAENDRRVREAFLALLAFARTNVPAAAYWMEGAVVRHAETTRFVRAPAEWAVDPALVETLLEACHPDHRQALRTLGIRVAAVHRDTARARTWFLQTAPGAKPTGAFLRALAHSPHDTDIQAAWALFDALSSGHAATSTRLADWMMMMRAAAGDRRIPARHVLALLQLYEHGSRAEAQRAVRHWRAPPEIGAQLAQSRVAHSCAIDGFLLRGDMEHAEMVWRAVLRRGIRADAALLTSVCKMYFLQGRTAAALDVVAQWCHTGVELPPAAAGWLCVDAEESAALENPRVRTDAAPLPARSLAVLSAQAPRTHAARVRPTRYLANTLLEGLLHAGSYSTLFSLWRALGTSIPVRPDVVSLDLVLRAAIAETRAAQHGPATDAEDAPGMLHPYATREYFRRTLYAQHPELAACRSALDTSAHSWLVRGEQRLQRWEHWLERRIAALFSARAPPELVLPETPRAIALDARVFYQYSLLLYTLREAGGGAGLYEELFRVPAYMRQLDLVPELRTLCLLYCAQDEVLPPGIARRPSHTPLYAALAPWLGADHVPSDEALGAWFRSVRG